jgi:hypothetical protein
MPPKVVAVPKTDPGAYNPNRPAGKLLQAQALHMREALIRHVHELTTLLDIDMKTLKTEADVSAYVHRATALLHTRAGKAAKK